MATHLQPAFLEATAEPSRVRDSNLTWLIDLHPVGRPVARFERDPKKTPLAENEGDRRLILR